jgi:glycosyltransferase involved in cell wall biosynthesis
MRDEMDKQDALVVCSLQESTSTVLMEALATGMPVICHDASGMSFAIDESCGIKVPLRARQTSVSGFTDAIVRLVTTQGLLNRLSQGALQRARENSWEEKVRQLAIAYDTAGSITKYSKDLGRPQGPSPG